MPGNTSQGYRVYLDARHFTGKTRSRVRIRLGADTMQVVPRNAVCSLATCKHIAGL